MPTPIFRKQVQELIDQGAQVVEVLEAEQYKEAHLPGARHIHLRQIPERAPNELDPSRPVVVYCWDSA